MRPAYQDRQLPRQRDCCSTAAVSAADTPDARTRR